MLNVLYAFDLEIVICLKYENKSILICN